MAAADLQTYVQKISGARLPIVTEPTANATKLFVGRIPHTDKLGITAEGFSCGAYSMQLRLILFWRIDHNLFRKTDIESLELGAQCCSRDAEQLRGLHLIAADLIEYFFQDN